MFDEEGYKLVENGRDRALDGIMDVYTTGHMAFREAIKRSNGTGVSIKTPPRLIFHSPMSA